MTDDLARAVIIMGDLLENLRDRRQVGFFFGQNHLCCLYIRQDRGQRLA